MLDPIDFILILRSFLPACGLARLLCHHTIDQFCHDGAPSTPRFIWLSFYGSSARDWEKGRDSETVGERCDIRLL